MRHDFIITKICNVIPYESQASDKVIAFRNNLSTSELIYHFSGKSLVCFNGKTALCEKNTVRFLPKGETRKYTVALMDHIECIDIFFDTDTCISDEMFTIKLNNDVAIAPLFKKIFSLWVAKNDGYYFECLSLLYKIFAICQKRTYLPESQYRKIKPAIEYIGENFTNEISIDKLSTLCGISDSTLKKLFIKKFGITPTKYIIGVRMHYACDLLRSGLYSVSQVSLMCGYNSLYYFSRQFKAHEGVSPSEYRKQMALAAK